MDWQGARQDAGFTVCLMMLMSNLVSVKNFCSIAMSQDVPYSLNLISHLYSILWNT
jgi:hypothetical protein